MLIHIKYAVTWSPLKIVWYIDGNPKRISTNHEIVDPFWVILNFAIESVYMTPFPSEMLVYYVKVNKLRNGCSSNLSIDNSNDFNSWGHRVKNSITINNVVNKIKFQVRLPLFNSRSRFSN